MTLEHPPPIFNRKYIFKWWMFHCHLGFRGVTDDIFALNLAQKPANFNEMGPSGLEECTSAVLLNSATVKQTNKQTNKQTAGYFP